MVKWLKDNQVKVLEWPSQIPDLNPIKCVGRTEKVCTTKEAYKPDSVAQLCQEELAKMYPTNCGKLVEGYPKRLTQGKHFESNATKY